MSIYIWLLLGVVIIVFLPFFVTFVEFFAVLILFGFAWIVERVSSFFVWVVKKLIGFPE